MNKILIGLSLLLIMNLHANGDCQLILAQSSFSDASAGLTGWQGINNDGDRETLERLEEADGSGGYIQLREDAGDSATMLFLAPPAFLGDQSRAYGGRLTFRLRQLHTDQLYIGPDVILESPGVRLEYFLGRIPSTSWQTFNVPLIEDGHWKREGRAATRVDLELVLGSLKKLAIRGEFSNRQKERTGLDDVHLIAEAPCLQITRLLDQQVVISWPMGYANARLEFSAGLSGDWMPVADSPIDRAGRTTVTLSSTDKFRVFRLVCGNKQ
jgi:hypothetical protein